MRSRAGNGATSAVLWGPDSDAFGSASLRFSVIAVKELAPWAGECQRSRGGHTTSSTAPAPANRGEEPAAAQLKWRAEEEYETAWVSTSPATGRKSRRR